MKKLGILLLAAAFAVCGLAVFSSCIRVEVPEHTHSFGEWTTVTEPTCTEEGLRERACACGEKESASIAALGHGKEMTVRENEVAATCTAGGSYEEVVYCAACGEELSRRTVASEPLSHNWNSVKTFEPTCESDGYTIYACSRCGATKQDDWTDKKGHNYQIVETVEPTCTEFGYAICECVFCGDRYYDAQFAVEHPPLGHEYSNGVCTRCGKQE